MSQRRPTKAERKEEARRQRIELQRQMARSRRNRLVAIVTVFLLLVAGVGLYLLLRPTPVNEESLLAQANAEARAAGCGEIQTVPPYSAEDDGTHIGTTPQVPSMPPLSDYPSIPPASGPHNVQPLVSGIYDTPPPIDQSIHSLEHGAVIIWYDADVAGQVVEDIVGFFDTPQRRDHVIVAPYDYPDQGPSGTLPDGDAMALVAWHHVRLCQRPSLAAAFDFVARYRSVPRVEGVPYDGDAPEPRGAV